MKKIKAVLLLVLLVMTGCGEKSQQASTQGGAPFAVHCATEPLPEFTLGANSHPTSEQVASLCSCIWNGLGSWERKAAEKISQGKESELSFSESRGFPSRFGSAIEQCDGMKL